jgi:predicted RNA methylase
MRRPKSNYELSSSQVATPAPVVDLYWRIMRTHRERIPRVLDLGAGDARFARGGNFDRYLGIEIDPQVAKTAKVPKNGRVRVGCAFSAHDEGFDGCIGNPPYVRHHYIASPWKQKTLGMLNKALRASLDGHGNLYLYFIALGLLKTHASGLIGLVVPFEWVSRPSAKGVRAILDREGWSVSVYRFQKPVFSRVLTTASISIIDKANRGGAWNYFDISDKFEIEPRTGFVSNGTSILKHSKRGKIFAQRGLSPGSQRIFTLTEGERIHHGLHLSDVVPCVTSLRAVPANVRTLDKAAFNTHLVENGKRCWLIKSNRKSLSERLRLYLAGILPSVRATWTCKNQVPWYNFEKPKVPRLLLHSGFTSHGPKVLVNKAGVVNVGSVYGVFLPVNVAAKRLQSYLLNRDVESRVVPHAKTLKKLEVGQVNSLLEDWWHVSRAK